MNNKTKLLMVLEELFNMYCSNYDLYSAAYIENLINIIYKGGNTNG